MSCGRTYIVRNVSSVDDFLKIATFILKLTIIIIKGLERRANDRKLNITRWYLIGHNIYILLLITYTFLHAHSCVELRIFSFLVFNVAQVPQWCFRCSVRGEVQRVQILRSDPPEENSRLRHIRYLAGFRFFGYAFWRMNEVIHEVAKCPQTFLFWSLTNKC